MANRLRKLAITTYAPGIAYQPAQPAYCVTNSYWVPEQYVVTSYTVVSGVDIDGNPVHYNRPNYTLVPRRQVHEKTCYPAKPAVVGVPPSTSYTAVTGWNAGASSISQLLEDGYVEFKAGATPFGVVAGISANDHGTLPSEQTHAFYIHGATVDIFESGALVAAGVVAHSPDNLYRITRKGGRVAYSVGGWSLTSGTPSDGPVVLDASLYASGDFVDSPAVVPLTGTPAHIAGSFAPLTGRLGYADYCELAGSFAPLSGSMTVRSDSTIAGSFAALTGVMADRPYTEITGSFAALTGSMEGGFPQVYVSGLYGSFAPLSGVAVVLSGEVAAISGSFGALTGFMADHPYSEISGSFAPLTGVMRESDRPSNEAYFASSLFFADWYKPDLVALARFTSGLKLGGGSFELTVFAGAYFSSTLLFGSTWSSSYALDASFSSSLRLGGSFTGLRAPQTLAEQMAAEPAQYAINAQTGAITQYAGFAFDGFARTDDQALYAVRPDGVYRVRQGDDDGAPLQARIDFGASDYGTSQIKRMAAVYFGLETDGDVTMRLDSDSGAQEYRVIHNGPMARVVTAKGASGRLWNMALEIEDATHFELDAIEAEVGATVRRLGRR